MTTFHDILNKDERFYWMEIYSPYGALYTKEAYVDIAEITTYVGVAAFERLFPADYYPYNNGYYDMNSFSEANGNKTIHVEWYCDIDLVLGRIFDLINESLKSERGIRIDILRYLICFGYNNKNRHQI